MQCNRAFAPLFLAALSLGSTFASAQPLPPTGQPGTTLLTPAPSYVLSLPHTLFRPGLAPYVELRAPADGYRPSLSSFPSSRDLALGLSYVPPAVGHQGIHFSLSGSLARPSQRDCPRYDLLPCQADHSPIRLGPASFANLELKVRIGF